MTVDLRENEQLAAYQKTGQTLSISMSFGGRIQFAGGKPLANQKLERLSALLAADPNANDVLPTSATPVEEDFIEVDWRALSATVLSDRPVDFSNQPMLKRSVKMLVGQTVYKDHMTSVDNWVGTVVDATWDDTIKDFPPGINAKLKLDMVKDPMAVRGVLQGAIHSASVTVSFQWKPSHPKMMDEGTFFNNLGEQVDGETVRILVTKIDKYWELSLVWQGADEFAKQIDDNGDPVLSPLTVNPDISHHHFSQANYNHSESLPGGTITGNLSYTRKETSVMKSKVQEYVKQAFSLEVEEAIAQEKILEHVESLKTASVEASAQLGEVRTSLEASQRETLALKEANAAAQAKVSELEQKVLGMEPHAKLGAQYLEDERKEVKRLYALAKGEKKSEVILKTLDEASLEVLKAWKEEFNAEVESKFAPRCGSCGSSNVSRRSSQDPQTDTTKDDVESFSVKTKQQIQSIHQ